MPGSVLIYDIVTHKDTNRSTKKIRSKILKGFRAWLLNELFGLMGKQNQTHTHRALQSLSIWTEFSHAEISFTAQSPQVNGKSQSAYVP